MIKKRVKKENCIEDDYLLIYMLGFKKGKNSLSLKEKKFCPLCHADLPPKRK